MLPKTKMQRAVEKLLTNAGFKFTRVDSVGWKVRSDDGYEYSWLEYQGSSQRDAVKLSVDKLRDGADNFTRLVAQFHNRVVEY